jgi:hypothetical protein
MRSASDVWRREQYTEFDLCSGGKWPFDDGQFDLGLCSHTLEDIEDPLPPVGELSRVCRRVLIICPSRLAEQCKGVCHPRTVGFPHHRWMVFERDGQPIFRKKTGAVYRRGAHLNCPLGKAIDKETGSMFWLGREPRPEKLVFQNAGEDYTECCRYLDPYRNRRDLFVHDGYPRSVRYWIWRMRQRFLGAP